jgi:hypothetical protein
MKKWFAVYFDLEVVPTALFMVPEVADAYARSTGKKAKIIPVNVLQSMIKNGSQMLVSAETPFNPWV